MKLLVVAAIVLLASCTPVSGPSVKISGEYTVQAITSGGR
jgi:hypothetical protein